MNDASQDGEARVASLAQEFSVRHRRGEHPTIEEYEARYPELAAEIRELFPMLCVLEDLGPTSQDSSFVADASRVAPPQRLGEYRILREIGRGGMGIVYEAEQEALRRRVAIKVLPFQLFQNAHQLERFRIEAQASARLHHTNIVPVFGVGVDQGIHYYVMQIIRGQTLADVLLEVKRLRAEPQGAPARQEILEEKPSTVAAKSLFVDPAQGSMAQDEQVASGRDDGAESAPLLEGQSASNPSTTSIGKDPRSVYCRRAARIALQVAEGLAYAHKEGILHRDIKPSNLLLDLKGTVWITDFGLAKVQDTSELTATGGLVGTLRYMAPERFKGEGDARSDVYGLGVTLYELLTLRPAFPSSDRAEVVKEVTESQPPPPRKIVPSIPKDLETIVLKAISKEPKDRYPNADALAQDLRSFLNYEPVNARRASVAERLWRWCQREPALAALTAVSLLLLLTLAIGSMVYAAHLGVERARAVERLVTSKLQEGRAWRLSREPGSRKRSLDALREAVTPATAREVRNEVIGSLALVELVETEKHEERGGVWAIDPEVKRSAVVLEKTCIQVYEGLGVSEPIARLRPPAGRRVNYVVLSSGGRCLAARSEDDAWIVWDVDRGEQLFECKARVEPPAATFDAASKRFTYLHPDGGLAIREVSGGGEPRRLEETSSPRSLCFDGAGRRLAAAGCGANLNIVTIHDLASGALISRLFHPNVVWSVDWHPDGKRVAVGCADYQVHIWDVESGQSLFRLKGHTGEVTRVCFGDRGRLIASGGWDNRALVWNADTGTLLTEAAGELLAFSDEDRRLGFTWGERTGGVGTWRVAGGEVCRVLHAPVGGKGPRKVAVSPDGRWLAAACYDRGLRVWSLDGAGESQQADAGTVRTVCFHPDGSALWTGTLDGLFRWPLRQAIGANEWTLGPPIEIARGYTRSISIRTDGRRAATISGNGEIVLRDLERDGASIASFAHPGATRCELSSSGRWLASSTFHGADVRVWDVEARAMVKSIPVGTAQVGISPDERWLAVASGVELLVLEVGAWTQRLRAPREGAGTLGGPLAFSRDGSLLAFARTRTSTSLLRMPDGEELARIDGPTGPMELYDLTFSPDQGLLLASVSQEAHVWDLRRIRSELARFGLDWGSAEGMPDLPTFEPRRLRIDSGRLPPGKADDLELRAATSKLLDLRSQQILLDPDPESYLARAAMLERLEDWPAALADLDRALETSAASARALMLRAAALERLGRLEEAEKDCVRAVSLCCGSTDGSSLPSEHARVCPVFRETLRIRARVESSLGLEHVASALSLWREFLGRSPGDREAEESIPWLWILKCCDDPATAPTGSPDLSSLALECAEKNLKRDPKRPAFLRDLGALKLHVHRLDEAEPLLEAACLLNAKMVSAAFHLSVVYQLQGKIERARSSFQAAATALRNAQLPTASAEAISRIRAFAQRALDGKVDSGVR